MSESIPLKELTERLERYEAYAAELKLQDPVAAQAGWDTISVPYFTVDQRRVKITSPQTALLRVSYLASFTSSFFLIIGLIALKILSQQDFNDLSEDLERLLMFLCPGLAFTLMGTQFLYKTNIFHRFDRHLGVYWRGFRQPQLSPGVRSNTELVLLKDVYAVQVTYSQVKYKRIYYCEAQVHLVLKDGSRCPVIQGRDLVLIRFDAEQLSQFLNVKLWSHKF